MSASDGDDRLAEMRKELETDNSMSGQVLKKFIGGAPAGGGAAGKVEDKKGK